jgi:hypothetical protein
MAPQPRQHLMQIMKNCEALLLHLRRGGRRSGTMTTGTPAEAAARTPL